jgi:hypothetical protein
MDHNASEEETDHSASEEELDHNASEVGRQAQEVPNGRHIALRFIAPGCLAGHLEGAPSLSGTLPA